MKKSIEKRLNKYIEDYSLFYIRVGFIVNLFFFDNGSVYLFNSIDIEDLSHWLKRRKY